MVSKFKLCGLLNMIMIHIILNTQMVNDNVEHWSAESDGIEVWNKFLTLSSSQQRPPLSLKQKACDPYSCLCHAELHSTANATWERVIVKKTICLFFILPIFLDLFHCPLQLSALLCAALQCHAMFCRGQKLPPRKCIATHFSGARTFCLAPILSNSHSFQLKTWIEILIEAHFPFLNDSCLGCRWWKREKANLTMYQSVFWQAGRWTSKWEKKSPSILGKCFMRDWQM